RRAAAATESGRFKNEIVPLKATREDGSVVEVSTDEGIRPTTTTETLASLKPVFQSDEWTRRFPEIPWVIHAGNASQISDGAAALLIMERSKAEQLGLPIRARFHTFAVTGDDPVLMLTGVIPATRLAL